MKRTRVDEDFNPVYPYDTTTTPAVPFISPPFVNSDGLQENPPGVLSLRIAKPLYFDMERKLALSLGRGLTITANGQLESTQSVQTNPPLTVTNNNTLILRYSSPLILTDNNLTVGFSSPLRVIDNKLTFTFTSPLRYENETLTFNYTEPLTLMNSNLALNVNSSKGLRVDGGSLGTNLSPDLRFNSSGAIAFGIQTLWTPPTSNPNCTVYTESDSLLSLCLTKCGAHVLGSVSLTGVAGTMTNMAETSLAIEFTFDDTGKLLHSPLVNNTFSIRQGDSPASNPTYNALAFMPNSTLYARGGSGEPRNNYYVQTYLRGNVQRPITLTVTFNSAATGYSLSFKWTAVVREKFAAPATSFCYITEQ
ncbi:fiber-1 [human adenovirus 52]|uniref:Fiber-1 n=1 Tax=human adenovirus 52 TaxID=332179 RepID=A0MK70_9ADEN|nr:fiber-1 [Human adenovirus 52]